MVRKYTPCDLIILKCVETIWLSKRSILVNVLCAPKKSLHSAVVDLMILLGQLGNVRYIGTFSTTKIFPCLFFSEISIFVSSGLAVCVYSLY